MAESDTINLVARWREGDQKAAAELFQRYANQLVSLAQHRLSAKLASRVDPEDVIQSVYCSFFVGARANRFVLEHSGDLWRLLVAITLHKVHHQVSRHTAGKRSVARERNGANPDDDFDFPVEMLAQDPSPAEAVILADTLEEVLRELDPVKRRMVEMRLQGYSTAEIVAATQRSRATVDRVLDRVKQQLGEGLA
jgi:RNA polymerase sigma-70 factor (ECF subfamily)